MITLWTDGSASPNPGPGGFAVMENGKPVALGREDNTTNIRMEGHALIAAMKYASGRECEIHTDSEFWMNVLKKWAYFWSLNGWAKANGDEVKNADLVEAAFELYRKGNVKLVWVKAHVGTTENESVDKWANLARKGVTMEKVRESGLVQEEGAEE